MVFSNFYPFADPLLLSPTAGNVAGGTAVFVSGPRFHITDRIMCIFGNQEVNGTVLNQDNALCISPQLSHTGRIPFRLRQNGFLQRAEAIFYSGEHMHVYILIHC